MDISRKIGIGIVMIVPTFVGSGAVWGIFHNYFACFIWIVIMAFGYRNLIKTKPINV